MEPKDTNDDQTEKIQTTNDNASLPIKEYEKTTPSEKIPEQLRNPDFRFIPVEPKQKKPKEKHFNWNTTNNYCYDDKILTDWIDAGGNYGVLGGFGNLVIIDFDDIKTQNELQPLLRETFMVRTAGKGLHHLYFIVDKPKSNKLLAYDKSVGNNRAENETLLDIQGPDRMVVGPGSKAYRKDKSLGTYEVVHNVPIAKMAMGAIEAIIYADDRIKQASTTLFKTKKENRPKKGSDGDDNIEKVKKAVPIKALLGQLGIDVSKNPTDCPLHSSMGGKCLSFDEKNDVYHCFHCESEGNIFSLYQEVKKINFFTALKELAEQNDIQLTPRRSFVKDDGYDNLSLEDKKKYLMARIIAGSLDYIELAKEFIKEFQPLYYDEAKIWWVWNYTKCIWEMKDEVSILSIIIKHLDYNSVIKSNIKNQILTAFQIVSRDFKPEEPPLNYIQFGRNYVDINTGNIFPSTPEYFNTNTIPWDVGDSEETPMMDKFFREWMTNEGDTELMIQKKILKLYEIIAYCCYRGYPLARIFCFVGAGANGKSTYLKLIRNFLGVENVANVELDALTDSSNRFATTALYKKLVCTMGETNFGTMKRTQKLKEITGGDLINIEFKGKTGFNIVNYATVIIATNTLPQTSDKTIGFYRRWDITDFRNIFTKEKDVLDDIPDQEYNNLGRKILSKLKKILNDGKFSGEMSIQQKKEMYEDRSDPIQKFIKENIEENVNAHIPKWEFEARFGEWCKSNGLRTLGKHEVNTRIKETYLWEDKKFFYKKDDGTDGRVWSWLDISWVRKLSPNSSTDQTVQTDQQYLSDSPRSSSNRVYMVSLDSLDSKFPIVEKTKTSEGVSTGNGYVSTGDLVKKDQESLQLGNKNDEKTEKVTKQPKTEEYTKTYTELSQKNKVIELIESGKKDVLTLLDAGISEDLIELMVKEGDIYITKPGEYGVLK